MLNYTALIVLSGSVILGLVAGTAGAFAVLRKQSLLGDAISHASLPGLAAAFLVTHSKNPMVLLSGALCAGWIGTSLVNMMIHRTKIKEDAALGMILSVFFGFGLVLLTYIQKLPLGNQAGLSHFLFGSAATLLMKDILVIAVSGGFVLINLLLFWKEFKCLTFDTEYAKSIGIPVEKVQFYLTCLIVIAIVIGLQTVGVVLMSALIIAPSAAARQWTDRFYKMILLSGFFGALSGGAGALLSSYWFNAPTGPTIVLVLSAIVFYSLLFSPHRGVIWNSIQGHRYRSNIRSQAMLTNMMLFSEVHSNEDPYHPHELAALTAIGRGPARKAMKHLLHEGYVTNPSGDLWGLTPEGLKKAKALWKENFESQ